jgi:hypothetical protein
MTSITMNGGTSLRADGCSRLFAFSSIAIRTQILRINPSIGLRHPAPLMPH